MDEGKSIITNKIKEAFIKGNNWCEITSFEISKCKDSETTIMEELHAMGFKVNKQINKSILLQWDNNKYVKEKKKCI